MSTRHGVDMLEKALDILKRIEKEGFKAYIVGGFARDYYLRLDSADVDICTSASPKELKEIFTGTMLPEINYGSVVVIYKKVRFEITTFREDIGYSNNRTPLEIRYVDNLSDDLKRRDFVMNTLCIDSSGNYIDLLDAMHDIDEKVIRMVGSPKYRLKEDVLRILRAIRFACVLNFKLDEELKEYIKKYAYLLKKLSYDRKKEELERIFLSKNSKYGIKLILDLELDKYLDLKDLEKVIITSSPIGIWAQLNVEKIYKFTNNEIETIDKIRELSNNFNLDNITIYKYGSYITTIASEIKNIDKNTVTEKYMSIPINSREEILVTGNDMCELLNIKPSKILNTIYEDITNKIVSLELKNEKEEILAYIEANYKV